MLGQNKGRSRQAGNPWAPDRDDQTKYALSQTLRDLVSDRMVEQQGCLAAQQKRVAKRVAQLDEARRRSAGRGPKGPGDQQLAAQTVKAITCDTTGPQLGGGPYGMGSPMGGFGGVTISVQPMMHPPPLMSPYAIPPHRSSGTAETKRRGPLERYEQLQSEIDALLAGVMASEDPMLAMEATTLMCHPGGDGASRVRVMMFEKLLAAPRRQEADSGSEEEEDDAASEFAEEEDERDPVMLPPPPRGAPRQAPNPPRGYVPRAAGGPGQRCPPPPQQHAQPPPPGGAPHPPIQRAPPPQQNMQPPAFGDPRQR
ncbi:hypothetical protein LTR53_000973 [Teratosphaeriaceae sp. CCFEE 6253]|nr:hypothetical protein LTR53_000973 [Teratosphaeriaceae sp. CCFEE 6253]